VKRISGEGFIGRLALREAATTELNQTMNLVRAALQASYDATGKAAGQPYSGWFDIEAMYADRVIVCKDGRYWQFGYTIDAGNNVQLEAPVEVIEQFLPVKLKEAIERERKILVADGAIGADAVFLEALAKDGSKWEAVLVRAGASKNGTFYPDAVLREAAPLFEGVRVFAKSDEDHIKDRGKDVRNITGWISGAKFIEGKLPDTGMVSGHVNLSAGTLRDTIADAWSRGKKDLVGLSIDAIGTAKVAMREAAAGVKRIAQSIKKVNSVDVIVDPSAGGALVRLVEAADNEGQGDMKLRERMLATIKEKNAALFATLNAETVTDEQLEAHYREAVAAPATDTQAGGVMTRKDFEEYQRLVEARQAAATKINATTLPQPSKDALIARFAKLARFSEADVDTEIKSEREFAVRMAESLGIDKGKVAFAAGDIQVGDRSVAIAAMLDAFFDPAHKDHRKVQSFKECYIEITGDRRITGRAEDMDRSRLAESVGEAFREGLDTTAFSNVLGSSITRRMVQDYNNVSEYDGYKLIIGSPVPLSDFRSQERVRFGGYGDLATVSQGAAYPALASPTDEKATYSPAKRGGTEDLTREAIKNDDVGAIRRIPMRMARAAKRTLAKFVFDFIRTNPTIYDSVAFFHASHGNLGSTAFSAAEYGVVRIAMGKQAELSSADRLGIFPALILYPLDLQETVWNAFQRNTNLDKTFVQQLNPTLIPVWYWTDTNDWAAMASPNDLQTIELGFVDGQEEPQLFVQDMPNVGSMFSNDKLTYKIRHEYGGTVVDYRGAYKEVV
jgi:hypothetical protein